MAKRNAKQEKRLRNELYAKKYEKEDEDTPKKKRSPKDATFANWCRMPGHPSTCRCTFA